MWTFIYNKPGYIPEMEPEVYETFDEAKRACIDEVLRQADSVDSESVAEELTASVELINLESDTFSMLLEDGYYYSVDEI